MDKNQKRVKLACYTVNATMSAVGNLSPILFLTFRNLYGISYTLLGLLVFINFITQLIVDLILSFFSHKFNIQKLVRTIPLISIVGMVIFGLCPYFFPNSAYLWLVVGTVIFSAASGLSEVLISPTIAALPSKDPDREMSKLHSVYAWGAVGVILVSTAYLLLFGSEQWQWLPLLFSLIPLSSVLLFSGATLPNMETPQKASGVLHLLKNKGVWFSVFGIFLAGASELSMAQWSSGYLEQALGIPKVWG
ncbi:MAG: MFS transporter, partial [Clostridia bacterium]|nr:MFS transporter [Clostridia bacterium]